MRVVEMGEDVLAMCAVGACIVAAIGTRHGFHDYATSTLVRVDQLPIGDGVCPILLLA